MNAQQLNGTWADDLAPAQQDVWKKLREQGAEARWEDLPELRFVLTRGAETLADHPRSDLPLAVVVSAALYEAGRKIEQEDSDVKILPSGADSQTTPRF